MSWVKQRTVGKKIDELEMHREARVIGPYDAVYGIFSGKGKAGLNKYENLANKGNFSVQRLRIHLEGKQFIYFDACRGVGSVEKYTTTTLTEYFKFCADHPEARCFKYHQMPEFFMWDKKNKIWRREKKDENKPWPTAEDEPTRNCVGNLQMVSPRSPEYFLRTLLLNIPGPINFDALKSEADGTYRTRCVELGRSCKHSHKLPIA